MMKNIRFSIMYIITKYFIIIAFVGKLNLKLSEFLRNLHNSFLHILYNKLFQWKLHRSFG